MFIDYVAAFSPLICTGIAVAIMQNMHYTQYEPCESDPAQVISVPAYACRGKPGVFLDRIRGLLNPHLPDPTPCRQPGAIYSPQDNILKTGLSACHE